MLAMDEHFVVQMWPGRVSRRTDPSNSRAPIYILAKGHSKRLLMRIQRHHPIAVIDHDGVSVSTLDASKDHSPGIGRLDRKTIPTIDINSRVEASCIGNGVDAPSKR